MKKSRCLENRASALGLPLLTSDLHNLQTFRLLSSTYFSQLHRRKKKKTAVQLRVGKKKVSGVVKCKKQKEKELKDGRRKKKERKGKKVAVGGGPVLAPNPRFVRSSLVYGGCCLSPQLKYYATERWLAHLAPTPLPSLWTFACYTLLLSVLRLSPGF